MAERAEQIGYQRREPVARHRGDDADIAGDGVDPPAHDVGCARPGRGLVPTGVVAGPRRRIGREIEEVRRQLDGADPVGHDVVGDRDERGPTTLEPLDQHEAPERAIAVEPGRRLDPCVLEQLVDRARFGQHDVPEVVVDVDHLDRHPLQRAGVERGRGHALPQRRYVVDRSADRCLDTVSVGHPVEDRHRHDRRPQQRVGLDLPHDRVVLAEVRQPLGHHPHDGVGASTAPGPKVMDLDVPDQAESAE